MQPKFIRDDRPLEWRPKRRPENWKEFNICIQTLSGMDLGMGEIEKGKLVKRKTRTAGVH